jgi:predicted RNA-binding protein YlxR (DUF448 family)
MPKLATLKRKPVRTCVGCRQEAGKLSLIRIVRRPAGGAIVDLTGHASGRGAYLHSDPVCLELARKKRALDRALNTQIQPDLWSELLA